MSRTRSRPSASLVYLSFEAAGGLLFTMMATIFAVYVIVDGGLTAFQLLRTYAQGTAVQLDRTVRSSG